MTGVKKRPISAHPARTRVLTGVKPTGDIHLGNYYGAIKPAIEMSKSSEHEVILMCVDWHGLTNRTKILEPGASTVGLLAAFLALGFELNGNALLLQSHFPEIIENAWYLSCVTSVGLLERAHAFKDAVSNGKEATGGLFYYPLLMAADIMTFDAELVPVGKDQAQHLEYASDMARHFNTATKCDVFYEPTPMIQETPTLVGTDGERKMSKSYGNEIPMFGKPKDIEKKIKEIKTDSKGLDDPKDPDTCPVFQILCSFASDDAIMYMREKLTNGKGYGYGHAKKDLLDEHVRVFGKKQELYEHYVNNPSELHKLLQNGHNQMKTVAQLVRERARQALGLLGNA